MLNGGVCGFMTADQRGSFDRSATGSEMWSEMTTSEAEYDGSSDGERAMPSTQGERMAPVQIQKRSIVKWKALHP